MEKFTLETLIQKLYPSLLEDERFANFVRGVNCHGYLDYLGKYEVSDFEFSTYHILGYISFMNEEEYVPGELSYLTAFEFAFDEDGDVKNFHLYQGYDFEERNERIDYGVAVYYYHCVFKPNNPLVLGGHAEVGIEHRESVTYHQTVSWGVMDEWEKYQKNYEYWREFDYLGEKVFAFLIKREERRMRKMIGKWFDIASKPPNGRLFLLDMRRAGAEGFLHE